MKKYLFIVLLVGVCFGQDGFFSKFKSKYPKLYCSECDLTMKQTIGGFVCVDGHTRIEKSAFMKDEDGNYYLPAKGTSSSYKKDNNEAQINLGEIHTLENHLDKAGNHLQKSFKRHIYALSLAIISTRYSFAVVGDALGNDDGEIKDSDVLMIRASSIASLYNYIAGLIELNNAGKELKKASKSIRK